MTVSTTAPAVLSALVAALKALPELNGVEVISAPVGQEPKEVLEFWRIDQNAVWVSFGKTAGRPLHQEEYDLVGAVRASAAGAGETAASAARDRAYAILKVMSDYLRENPTLGDTVDGGILRSSTCDQGIKDSRRWAQIEFTVHIEARI